MSLLVYLASPYSHADSDVRQRRYVEVCRAAATLMLAPERPVVFSPIAHSHPVAEHGGLHATDHQFWMGQCLPMLSRSDELAVLCIDGWRESRGVREEIGYAMDLDIPVRYIEG